MPRTSTQTGVDNFEMINVKKFRGYYSSEDSTTIDPPNVLVRGSQNVYKTPQGTIANRPGRKQYDVSDATIAGVKAAYVWATSLGLNRILCVANSKLEVVSDIVTSGTFVHYTLLSSLTETRGVFDPWWNNTLKKDQLLFVLGNSNLYMWHGGIGKISSTTGTTIVLTATVASQGFNTTSGSVLINGTTYAYTGSSASTLTGVTPDPTGEANGSAVISTVTTTATTPASGFTNDFLKVIRNRVHVGSYTSRLVYISDDADYTNYTVPATRVAGDPEIITLDGVGKGISVRGSALKGNAHIFGGTSDVYIVTYEQITVGSTLTEQTNVDKRNLGLAGSAYAHEFIDSYGDSLIWLTQDQQVKTLGTYVGSDSDQYPVISHQIVVDLVNEDFTLGQLKIIGGGDKGDIIYLTAPTAGVTYLYQMRTVVNEQGQVVSERLWHSPFVWGLSRIDAVGDTVIGFSNSNPQIYTLWDTLQWHDDAPSDAQLSYTSIMLLPYMNFGRRQGKLQFNRALWEGFITTGTSLYSAFYYDYQGSTSVLSPFIHSIVDNSAAQDASFFTGVTPPSLGDYPLGENPLGDRTAVLQGNATIQDRDLLPKFRIITEVQLINCFEVAIMAFTSRAADRWEIINIGLNVTEAPFNAVEIIKQT